METIPKSLLTTETGDKKCLIHPKYKLLKHRLEVVWFKDIRLLQHGGHSSFKKMEKSIDAGVSELKFKWPIKESLTGFIMLLDMEDAL